MTIYLPNAKKRMDDDYFVPQAMAVIAANFN